jgi:hypothetical protein
LKKNKEVKYMKFYKRKILSALSVFTLMLLFMVSYASAGADLITDEIDINPGCTSVVDELFVNESNEICAVIENIGDADTGAFDVCFAADGISIGCVAVGGLDHGANTTVCVTWTPDCAMDPIDRSTPTPVTINVTADCNCGSCPNCPPDGTCGEITEDNETNNLLSLNTAVYENGYKSENFGCDEDPLTLYTYEEMYGGVVYNVSGEKNYPFDPAETDTRVHSITIPSGMNVKEARLYVYSYDYWSNPLPGFLPDFDVTFAGVTHTSPDAAYDDQKGFGSYNTPKMTYAYDVTSQVAGSGDYSVSIENAGPNKTTLLGEMLVVIYEDPAMNADNWMKLWVLEGCDHLMASHGSYQYCASVQEATATVTFPGTIDTPSLISAELIAVASQGMAPGTNELINGVEIKHDAWDELSEAYPNSKINVEVNDVSTYLVSNDNTLGFEDNGSNGLHASNAILVVREGGIPNRVYLTPPDTSASYGNEVTVEMYADTTDLIQGGQFFLDFSGGCAKITDITFDGNWPYLTCDLDTTYPGAVFATFTKDPPTINGTQHICTLTVQCDNTGYCESDLKFKYEGDAGIPAGKGSKLAGSLGATWHDGTFTCMNLPDLVITEVYGIESAGNYVVSYTVKNEGNANASPNHSTTLMINSAVIEHKLVPVELAPGDTYSDTFVTETPVPPSGMNDMVVACADNYDDVIELDEANNCLMNCFPAGIEIRVDVQDDDECLDWQEQFIVNINVDPRNIPVHGVQYTLTFDKDLLHAEWQNEGSFLNHDGEDTVVAINEVNNGLGVIEFAASRLCEYGISSPSGTLAVIKFTAKVPGVTMTSLNLSGVVASNDDGISIEPLDLVNDTLCVAENEPPVAIGKSMHMYNNEGEKYICYTFFNGSESYDIDGEIVNFRWSFGDGTYGTGELKDHVYLSWNWDDLSESYEPMHVTLTVTDDGDPHQQYTVHEFDVIVYTAGDANGDGVVNILDLSRVGLNWGDSTTCEAYCWEGNPDGDKADLNNDCVINILDAVIIGTCWGHIAEI